MKHFCKLFLLCALVLSALNFIAPQNTYAATWTEQTGSGQRVWTSITSSSDGTKLAAVDVSGYIYTSTDSGATWTERTGSGRQSITSSSDGTKLAAIVLGGYIYTSTDSGATWTERQGAGSRTWFSITSSSDGTKLAAVDNNGYIYTSTDSGATWTERTGAGSRQWYSITSSSDGTKLSTVDSSGYIYTSTDSGATWTERQGAGSRSWRSITSSSDGTKLAAVVQSGYIYTSTDSGATWTERTGAGQRYWQSITSSSDGTKLAAVDSNNGYIYTSTDSGATWTEETSAGSRQWYSITSSSDGTKLAAGVFWGYIYTTSNAGGGSSDSTPPTITSVSSNKANGTYGVGEVIDIDVTFSEAVTSTGNVTVTLETGTTDRTCTFTVSNSTTGTCNYTVQTGDTSADLTVNSISGTIADQSSNAMSSYTIASNLAANKALVIDTTPVDSTPPTITSVSSSKTNGTYGVGEVIDIDVTFSEAVTSTGNVTVTLETGTTDRTCTFTVSNSTTGTCNYTVQSGDSSADLTVNSISGTIADQSSNAMSSYTIASNLAANKALVIDTVVPGSAPTITNVTSSKTNGTYGVGTAIDITLTFSEPVTGAGTILTNIGRKCYFFVINSTTATCTIKVVNGNKTSDLTIRRISTFTQAGGAYALKDADNTLMTNFVPTTNLGANKNIVIDTVQTKLSVGKPKITTTTVIFTVKTSLPNTITVTDRDNTSVNNVALSSIVEGKSAKVTITGLTSCTTYAFRFTATNTRISEPVVVKTKCS